MDKKLNVFTADFIVILVKIEGRARVRCCTHTFVVVMAVPQGESVYSPLEAELHQSTHCSAREEDNFLPPTSHMITRDDRQRNNNKKNVNLITQRISVFSKVNKVFFRIMPSISQHWREHIWMTAGFTDILRQFVQVGKNVVSHYNMIRLGRQNMILLINISKLKMWSLGNCFFSSHISHWNYIYSFFLIN